MKGEVEANRVLQIIQAVEGSGIRCWLAGGWGVDALIGHQTRRHDDVDLVVEDFPRQAPKACDALSTIGFRLTGRYHQPVWMPDQWTLEDDHACRIDLLSLDWERLAVAGVPGADEAPLASLEELMATSVTEGMIGGTRVSCLTADVQRVFHSGFEPRHSDRHDLAELTRGEAPILTEEAGIGIPGR
jgi:lincosamide nucleotidyltransferase A/C/D/E